MFFSVTFETFGLEEKSRSFVFVVTIFVESVTSFRPLYDVVAYGLKHFASNTNTGAL